MERYYVVQRRYKKRERDAYGFPKAGGEEIWSEWRDLVPSHSVDSARESAAVFKRCNPDQEYRVEFKEFNP